MEIISKSIFNSVVNGYIHFIEITSIYHITIIYFKHRNIYSYLVFSTFISTPSTLSEHDMRVLVLVLVRDRNVHFPHEITWFSLVDFKPGGILEKFL